MCLWAEVVKTKEREIPDRPRRYRKSRESDSHDDTRRNDLPTYLYVRPTLGTININTSTSLFSSKSWYGEAIRGDSVDTPPSQEILCCTTKVGDSEN
jgi:hypothetical protein